MTEPAMQRFVLVVVSPEVAGEREDVSRSVGDALGDVCGRTVPARILGAGAAEFALDDLDPEQFALVTDLVSRLSERCDAALLPGDNRRKRLLISDMDATIIGQECLDELADFAGVKAQVSAITEAAMRGDLDFEGALKTRVALLEGLPVAVLEQCWRERISLNPGARTLVATMAAHGARCVLVSGGFTFFTSRVAQLAGFQADQANILIKSGGKLTGKVAEPILGRAAKRAALEREAAGLGLSPSDALALGDGANDLDMIRAAGLGVAYRAKPVVAAQAHAAIRHTDLTTALYFQGYQSDAFVTGNPPD